MFAYSSVFLCISFFMFNKRTCLIGVHRVRFWTTSDFWPHRLLRLFWTRFPVDGAFSRHFVSLSALYKQFQFSHSVFGPDWVQHAYPNCIDHFHYVSAPVLNYQRITHRHRQKHRLLDNASLYDSNCRLSAVHCYRPYTVTIVFTAMH